MPIPYRAWRSLRVLLSMALPLSAAAQSPPAQSPPAQTPPTQTAPPPQVIAYVFPDRPLTLTDINPAQLTRINYAFALIRNGRVIEGSPADAANLAVLHSLKTAHPGLQIFVSVGGWLGSGGFSDAALTPASRHVFVDSALAFLTRYDLDGLDLDWEYPGLPGAGNPHRPEDGANFVLLLAELRTRFDAGTRTTHKPLRLSIAAASFPQYLEQTPVAQLARYLDTVNLMAYDFYEPGDGSKPVPTGNHAALFPDPADRHPQSAAGAVQAFRQAGIPAAKLVLGVPFYGHLWGDVPPANHGLFGTGVAVPSIHTSYPDITALLTHGFTRYWDGASQVPYAYNEAAHQFLSYEDPESLQRKCAYIRQQGLAGIMFWQYLADPSGTLLNAIATSFRTVPAPASPHP